MRSSLMQLNSIKIKPHVHTGSCCGNMNARKKAFLLNFFVDEGLEANLLTQAVHLVTGSEKFITNKDGKNKYKICTLSQHIMDDQFGDQFCMERGTFEKLLRLLNGVLGESGFIAYVPLHQKLLYTLSLLRGIITYRQAGKTFGIGTSCGIEIYKWMTSAFDTLLPRYVKWSYKESGPDAKLPGVVGVIGECQIPLRFPIQFEHTDKTVKNLIVQSVCDEHSRFLDLYIDFSDGDQQCLLLKSPLYERLIDIAKPLMPKTKHLVGDTSYPLLLNLMTPFPEDTELTPCHLEYNQAVQMLLGRCERGFRGFKSRFGRLQNLDIASLDVGRRIISACCMLHNFILDCGERIEDSSIDLKVRRESHSNLPFEDHNLLDWSYTREAERKRNNLAAKFIKTNQHFRN